MTDKATSDLWWKNAIFYCADVKTFLDSDGDGFGDIAGLTRRLDYLQDLGVTCLWLMPCYPSPLRDDGYDVSDFYTVDPRLGTLGDFVELVRTARSLGIRVLVDLVLNHTSDTHHWFLEARRDRDGRFRDYYVWADEPQPDSRGVVFPGEQDSTWSYDERAGQWYFHRYYDFQPDLNIANPVVRDELNKILGFWLELGVDGFRIDSLPFLIELGVEDTSVNDPHQYLRDLRSFVTRRRGNAVLVGEANVPVEEQRTFFGDPRCPHDFSQAHMLFDFALQAGLWLAFARGEAMPVRRALERRPDIPSECQYLVFVRHHDELTLEHVLSPEEAQEVCSAFDPEGKAVAYGRGLRRRLAPLLAGDEQRIRLALSLLMAMPGTPVLLYGDEIGLGDDLSLHGRTAVRVPMQWSDRDAGGFSTAPDDRLIRPVRRDGHFGYGQVNVTGQRADPQSRLNFAKQVISVRRRCAEVGNGTFKILDSGHPAVLALRHDWRDGCVVTVHNLCAEPVEAQLDTGATGNEPAMVLLTETGAQDPGATGKLDVPIELPGHGLRWLRVVRDPGQTGSW